MLGISEHPSSANSVSVTSMRRRISGSEASKTCNMRSESAVCSSVERNASTRWWGSRLINPTVSESSTALPSGSSSAREVTSSVAKSLFSVRTPASVSRLNSDDLPAFVYPTIDTIKTPSFFLRFPINFLCCSSSRSSRSSVVMRMRICLRSVSSFVSPGPLVPIPPPRRESALPAPTSLESL